MKKPTYATLSEHFACLPDPRIDRTKLHSLHSLLVLSICAILGGANNWVEVERFADAKRAWFETFVDLPHGIPSHDTFSRVFSLLDAEAFAACFRAWMNTVVQTTEGTVVAVDGKTLRGSFDRASGQAAIHMVSAFAKENQVVLGQIKTEEKSNEITAIPRLLKLLSLSGCIVTIDAMGCQREIAKTILDKKADYVFSLKGNQGTLHREVEEFFTFAQQERFQGIPHDVHETVEKDHGRIETRRVVCTQEIDWFADKQNWAGLRSFIYVDAETIQGGNTMKERRFFISSLPGEQAALFAHVIRSHWSVENQLHWNLDVTFREDQSRVRKDQGPQNFALLRHIALNLLKQDKTSKLGVKNKRLTCGWDERFLEKILGF